MYIYIYVYRCPSLVNKRLQNLVLFESISMLEYLLDGHRGCKCEACIQSKIIKVRLIVEGNIIG